MNKPIYIHAGAHRTGTSSFQLCLHLNREVLDNHGLDLAYPGRDGVPGGKLRLQLPRPRHGEKRIPAFAERARETLNRLSPAPNRGLILSEENLPGPMRHFYDGRFFPASHKRFQALAMALQTPPRHVIYVVRNYAELYVSAYRKRAEDNAMPAFDQLVPRFMAIDSGWPELIAQMRDILRPQLLSILPYERRGESRSLLARLVPDLNMAELSEPQRTMNLSATDAALTALQALYHAGETLGRAEWQQVVTDHAEQRAESGFATFSPEDRSALQHRYEQDLERLSGMSGLTFL